MSPRQAHDPFSPPAAPSRTASWAVALGVHLLVIVALLWSVRNPRDSDQPAVEAELWSAAAEQAAPVPPAPAPVVTPAPKPATVQDDDALEAEIALRQKKEQEKKLRAQKEREQAERKEEERKKQLEQEKKERLQKEKEAKEKAEKEKADKARADAKAADAKAKAAADAKAAEAQRQDNLTRMQNLAGAAGAGNAAKGGSPSGNSKGTGGPSAGYAGMVVAKVKPNITFPDDIPGNPRAEIEVRAAPDGTIVGIRITTSSGNAAWDQAVVRALQKTETLPRDRDGRVPSALVIGFRPKD